MKCSDFIVKFLKMNTIDVVFDFTGGMVINIEDSIYKEDGINCFPTRHEQASGFAAEGYSRISGNFGVALATSGPGATNLITAIGSCYFDSTSTLFITGQVNIADLKKEHKTRQNGFQEMDIVSIVEPITKYSKIILDERTIKYELEKALFIMKDGRPGPVLLDIPFDIQTKDVDPDDLVSFIGSEEHKKLKIPSETDHQLDSLIAKAKEMLTKSKRPVIVVGNGIKLSKTQEQLKFFAESNNIPVVCSLMGLDVIPFDDSCFLGFIGTYGNRSANIAMANSDLVIALGSRLDLRQTGDWGKFIENKEIIHIDIDVYSKKEDLDRYLFIKSDLNLFFEALSNFSMPSKKGWTDFVEEIKIQFDSGLFYDEKCVANNLLNKLSNLSPEHTIVVGDVGQNQMWLAQSWKVKNGQKILFSGGMGAMGFSIPTAIGAFCADKEACVIAVCGDGGFQINIQELETIKKNNLPIKIIIFNNNSLGLVRGFQDEYFEGVHQSTVIGYSCPSIKKISEAYGLEYLLIKDDSSEKDLLNIFETKNSLIVEVVLSSESKLEPKVRYGESLDTQFPYLSEEKMIELKSLKDKYLSDEKNRDIYK